MCKHKSMNENENLNQNESMNDIMESFDMLVTFKDLNEISTQVMGIKEIELVLDNNNPINGNYKSNFYIKESEFYNAVKVDLYIDKYEAVHKIAQTPTEVIEKAIPIDTVVKSTADNIIEAILEIASIKIAKEESFTVEGMLRSRFESLNNTINSVPDLISQKLNLPFADKNTDWIIVIEELGEDTGIAICKPEEIIIK
jgi:tRNA acetyltransferase TAN1